MNRLLHSAVIAFAFSVFVLVLSNELLAGAGESGKNGRARELIDDFGSKAVSVVYPKEGNPYLIIPKNFDWEKHRKMQTTVDDLIKLGVDAFPFVAAHVNDGRFCCFTKGAVDRPHNVGWMCNEIMKRQIDVCRFSVKDKSELVQRYELEDRVLSRDGAKNWIEWWEKNKDKSLLQMQMAVAESYLSILKRDKNRHDSRNWGSRQLKEIEQLIRELKAEKKPKPCELYGKLKPGEISEIRLIDQSGVVKIGDEERYEFYNGK